MSKLKFSVILLLREGILSLKDIRGKCENTEDEKRLPTVFRVTPGPQGWVWVYRKKRSRWWDLQLTKF